MSVSCVFSVTDLERDLLGGTYYLEGISSHLLWLFGFVSAVSGKVGGETCVRRALLGFWHCAEKCMLYIYIQRGGIIGRSTKS
jgi:hypothetical protein